MRRSLFAIAMFAIVAVVPLRTTATDWSAYYSSSPVQGDTTLAMAPGEVRTVTLTYKNEGLYRWRGDGTGWRYVSLYTIAPYARTSAFHASSWHSRVQPAILDQARVEPGQTGTVTFDLAAPTAPGEYDEAFQLAVEDTAWVRGGAVTFHITVGAAAGPQAAKAELSRVYASRTDLRELFSANDWTAVDSPATAGIADLEDWARQYGYKEYPSLLSWYSPAKETTTAPADPPPAPSVPPALEVVTSAPAPRSDGAVFSPTLVTADDYLVIDDASKRVLAEHNADVTHPLASISKLMTSMVVLDSKTPMWKTFTMTSDDEVGGARLRVDDGSAITLSDLMYSALVGSANNAAHAMARATGLAMPDFVDRMNAKASALGLARTHFEDPTGLDVRNVSTARDIAALASTAFDDYYAIRKMASTQQITVMAGDTPHTITNTDGLLTDDTNGLIVLGSKTGYLIESKWNLVIRVMDARRRPLDVIVLGSGSRSDSMSDAARLARWTWDHYAW